MAIDRQRDISLTLSEMMTRFFLTH